MRNRDLFIAGAIILCIGLVFALISISSYKPYKDFMDKAKITTAKMVEVDKKHNKVKIEFFINGDEYKKEITSYDKDAYVGKSLTIFYKEEDPNIFKDENSNLFLKVTMIIGLILFFAGAFTSTYALDRKLRTKRIIKEK